jgi:ABC-type ATPase with predicted acetyltransferase domain
MYASNQGEITLYRCETCGSLIEYSGADKTEAAPFWVLRGQEAV